MKNDSKDNNLPVRLYLDRFYRISKIVKKVSYLMSTLPLLRNAKELMYNDAPWCVSDMDDKYFIVMSVLRGQLQYILVYSQLEVFF